MKVALLGAHTALARNVVESADDQGLEVDWVLAATSGQLEPDLVLLDPDRLRGADAFVVAYDDPLIRNLARGLAERGSVVIDALGDRELPLRSPSWRGPVQAPEGAFRVPLGPTTPAALLIEAVVAGLNDAAGPGALAVHLTCLESGAQADQPGIEEVSDSTRAVFTMQDRAPEHFPVPLAFSAWGAALGSDGDLERDLTAPGLPPVTARRLTIPSFSGELLGLDVILDGPATEITFQAVDAALSQAPRVRRSPAAVTTADAVGREDLTLAPVRRSTRSLHLLGAYDRLRLGSASAVARWLSPL